MKSNTIFLALIFLVCSAVIVQKAEASPDRIQDTTKILFYNDDKKLPVERIGGKAFNLILLGNIPEISVPKWFVITVDVFDDYLKENGIDVLIEKLNKMSESAFVDQKLLAKLASNIQHEILNGKINSDTKKKIYDAYINLKKETGKTTRWAVRSSGVSEDLSNASFAGLYDSYLNQNSIADINLAIKKVWASSFNLRSIQERIRLKQRQAQYEIAVIVQEMVKPVVTAGVATTIELSTNYPGIEITANYGLGESVVSGEIECDKWLVHENRDYIIKQVLGSKKDYTKTSMSNIKRVSTPFKKQQIFSMDNPTILRLASKVRSIKKFYQQDVDIEFAMDNKGQFFFMQARPLVKTKNNLFVIDSKSARKAKVIVKGLYSLPTVKHGTLKFIKKWEELTQNSIPHETIIMAYRADNTWSHYISNISGLITKEGSPASHVMLLARERGIACLSGIEDKFEKLFQYENKVVTLDGINRVVYAGKIPLKKATQVDFIKTFQTVKVDPLPSFESQLDYFKNSGITLFADGKYWIKTPQYPLKKFEQEINLNRFNILPDLVGKKQMIEDKAKVIENYVYCLLLGLKNMADSFNFASVKEAERYVERQEQNIDKYLKITKNFVLNKKNWEEYTQYYTKFRAYNWVGTAYRAYLTRIIQQEAKDLDLPQYYLDEAYSTIQAGLYEEDTQMQEDIHNFAKKIIRLRELDNLKQLEVSYPKLFSELVRIGKTYRFICDVGIDKPLNLQAVYDKVILEVKNIKMGGELISQKGKAAETYLPDYPRLRKMIELSLRDRINQSNSHHYLIRGQWQVREQLLSLGEKLVKRGKLRATEDIFDCSIKEIADYADLIAIN